MNKALFFAALSLAVFAAMSAVLIVPPLLVEIGAELDVSVPVAGQLATATFAAWAVSLLCVGPLSDSFGRRPVALAGLGILAVSALASAFARQHRNSVGAPRVDRPGRRHAPTDRKSECCPDVISPARRAQAITAILSVQGVVAGVTVPMVAVLADLGGWRLPFVVVGGLLASALLVNWVWFPRDKRERNAQPGVFLQVLLVAFVTLFPGGDCGRRNPARFVLGHAQFSSPLTCSSLMTFLWRWWPFRW